MAFEEQVKSNVVRVQVEKTTEDTIKLNKDRR
jgi:hypothetical protein